VSKPCFIIVSLCVPLICAGLITSAADARTTGATLTKQAYKPQRFVAQHYEGTGFSKVKFTPRRFTPQRNLGKLTAMRSAPNPSRGERDRLRLIVKGADNIRVASTRRSRVLRYVAHGERNRTVRGGFRTGM